MPVAKVKPVLTNMQAIPMRVGTMNTDVYSRTVSGKITSSSILKIFIGTFFKTGNFRLFKLFCLICYNWYRAYQIIMLILESEPGTFGFERRAVPQTLSKFAISLSTEGEM